MADVISDAAYWLFVHGHSAPVTISDDDWLDVLLHIRDGFAIRDEFGNPVIPPLAWELLQQFFGSFND